MLASVCDPSYAPSMNAIATKIGALQGPPCLIWKIQQTAQGLPDCTVIADFPIDGTRTPYENCGVTGNAPPCWSLSAGQGSCTGQTLNVVEINQSTNLSVTCAICQPASPPRAAEFSRPGAARQRLTLGGARVISCLMTDSSEANPDSDGHAVPAASLRGYLLMVAVGAFATTFSQQRLMGNYPILFHLKERLHFSKEQVSEFFLWATFAWNLKPLAGVLTDAFPLRGSRRRAYLILGGLVGAAAWAALASARDDYHAFLLVSILINVGLVVASTAMGGLQVEAGQLFGISGRVSSLRQVVVSIAQVLAPLLGGVLAKRALGLTAGVGALVMLSMAAVALLAFRERPVRVEVTAPPTVLHERWRYRPSAAIWVGIGILAAAGTTSVLIPGMLNVGLSLYAMLAVFLLVLALAVARVRNPVLLQAQGQLSQILRSRTLWLAVGMLFLVYVVPGTNTALTYRQSDQLHFSKEMIGRLDAVQGFFAIAFAIVYAFACKWLNLRTLIIIAIVTNAAGTLLFLVYDASSAYPIHAINGALGVISEVALLDLAVRSTPRGCEALGFALMISVRNFGIAMSDVVGSKLMDQAHFSFNTLVLLNAATTAAVLLFVPALPRALVLRKEGELA
jgi:predicted MFS family arabinose efflux permease